MKSRTRSRSVCDLGAGVEVHRCPLLVALLGRANASSGAAPVAGEELAVLLEQPGQLELGDLGQVALEDPRRLAAGQLRRDREEELVDQAGA